MHLDPANGEVVAKVVLFGPPGAGRATNLRFLAEHLAATTKTAVEPIDLDQEVGLAFSFIDLPHHRVGDHPFHVEVATTTGQSRFIKTRAALLERVDAVIFIADSRRQALDDDIEAMNELLDHLRLYQAPEGLPMVLQLNHQDHDTALPAAQLVPLLNHLQLPVVEASAISGSGVLEAWDTVYTPLLATARDHLAELEAVAEADIVEAEPDAPPGAGNDSERSWLLSCHHCQSMVEVTNAAVGDVFTCGSCGAALEVVDPEHGLTRPPQQQVVVKSSGRPTTDETYVFQSLPPGAPAAPAAPPGTPLRPAGGPGQEPGRPFPLEGYELLEALDESPLGKRFRVREVANNRRLRCLRPDDRVLNVTGYRQQLEPYARMAGKVHHASVLPVVGLRWHQNIPYILSQDTVSHEPLSRVLARRRVLQPAQAVDVLRQLALALEEASRQGVVHGQLSPDAVLIDANNQVLIDDLAVPKPHQHLLQAATGNSPATEHYLAPEHLMVEAPSDIRTDVFLLGALLFRMVSGNGLVTGYNAVEALNRVTATGPTPLEAVKPDLPRELLATYARLTAVERKDRFQHYGELLEALEQVEAALSRGSLTTGATRRGTGRNTRVQTPGTMRRQGRRPGSGPNRRKTGGHARGTGPHHQTHGTGPIAHGTGPIGHGTGPIGHGTGPIGHGTGPIGHGTGPIGHGTGPIRHGTGPIGPGTGPLTTTKRRLNPTIEAATRPHHRRKKESSAATVIVIVFLIVIGAIGFLAVQVARTSRPAVDNGSGGSDGSNLIAASPKARAERLVDAYTTDPADENAYQQARSALREVVGPARAGLEARLREARERHRERVAGPSGGEPTTTPPAANEGSTGLTNLEQKQIRDLLAEQRFGAARAFLTRTQATETGRAFFSDLITNGHQAARTAAATAARAATDLASAEAVLAPAQDTWGMDGDQAWAEQLLAEIKDQIASSGTTANPTNPGPGPIAPPIAEQPRRPVQRSPAGYTHTALAASSEVDQALRSGRASDVRTIMAKVTAGDIARPAIELKVNLWAERIPTLENAIAAGDRKLRVTNPIDGGRVLWDVVGAKEAGLNIHNPTTAARTLIAWSQVSDDDLGRLFRDAAESKEADAKAIAVSAIVNLVLGQTAHATLLARRAEEASYAGAKNLNHALELERETRLLAGIRAGQSAIASRDQAALAKAIEAIDLPRTRAIEEAAAWLEWMEASATALAAGGDPPPEPASATLASGQPQPGVPEPRPLGPPGERRLTFDDPTERQFFPEREGWVVGGGAIANGRDRAPLATDGCGTFARVSLDLRPLVAEGGVVIHFRGLRVVADFTAERLAADARGQGARRDIGVSWTADTSYPLTLTLDQGRGRYSITLGAREPLDLPTGTIDDRFSLSTDTGARIALEAITFGSGGSPSTAPTGRAPALDQAVLADLGLIPLGATGKSPSAPTIVLPGSSRQPAGLAIPLRSGTRSVSFAARGEGELILAFRPLADAYSADDGTAVPLPGPAEKEVAITVTLGRDGATLRFSYPDGRTRESDSSIPPGADHLVLLAFDPATLAATPEISR